MKTTHCYQLFDADSGKLLLAQTQVAVSWWSRFAGLMLRKNLEGGLLIAPCASLHTMWMRFAIDVFFLSSRGTVMEVRRSIPPWRLVIPKLKSHAVLETRTGQLHVGEGTALKLAYRDQRVPRRLEFMV
ncbi:MAG: DUF192 domain-containing protein [Pirellulales bacterium]|nr:DUF192 domain-containing protein [Pirellulales bacterium]